MNEEDIKILEKFTKIVKGKDYNAKNGWHGYYDKELMDLGTAIEHLINRNKELEIITNGIKVLETNGVNDDTFYVIAKTDFLKGSYKHLLDDYIPKSKVEEKIEELIKEGRHYNANKIEVLQELLEKRK